MMQLLIYAYTYIYLYTYVYIYIYMSEYIYKKKYTHRRTCVYTLYIYIELCVYRHMYTHVYLDICTVTKHIQTSYAQVLPGWPPQWSAGNNRWSPSRWRHWWAPGRTLASSWAPLESQNIIGSRQGWDLACVNYGLGIFLYPVMPRIVQCHLQHMSPLRYNVPSANLQAQCDSSGQWWP